MRVYNISLCVPILLFYFVNALMICMWHQKDRENFSSTLFLLFNVYKSLAFSLFSFTLDSFTLSQKKKKNSFTLCGALSVLLLSLFFSLYLRLATTRVVTFAESPSLAD